MRNRQANKSYEKIFVMAGQKLLNSLSLFLLLYVRENLTRQISLNKHYSLFPESLRKASGVQSSSSVCFFYSERNNCDNKENVGMDDELITQIRILKISHNISYKQMAEELKIPYSSFRKYLCGNRPLPQDKRKILEEYLAIHTF